MAVSPGSLAYTFGETNGGFDADGSRLAELRREGR
jgi:hypothetical protein